MAATRLFSFRFDLQISPKRDYPARNARLDSSVHLQCRDLVRSLATILFDGPTGAIEFSGPLPADLARAVGWLRGHLSEPVRLDILAQVAGVRPRTLETHFKMFLGTTPLGWVRRMRLARARQEFVRRGADATVTDVALSAGFTQLGRFAAEYRKAFGELPSATVQRARNSSPQRFDRDFDEAIRLTLAALPYAFAVERQQCNAALEELCRPQELAPGYGLPKAVAGWCWAQRTAHNFSSTPDADRDRAYRLAQQAHDLARDDALTLTLSSGTLVLLHQLEEAERRLERALALDRGWHMHGFAAAGCRPISATATAPFAN